MSIRLNHVTKIFCAALIAVFVSGSSPMFAQDELPSAEKVLGAYVDALGGMQAHKKIKSRRQTGTLTVSLAGQEMEMNLRSVSRAPNHFKIEIDTPTGQTNIKVFDGKHSWELDGPQGDQLHDEKMTEQTAATAGFYGPVEWESNYESVTTVAEEDVEGKPAYKVQAKTKSGREFIHWFDKESGLMVKSKSTVSIPGIGEVEVESFPSEYKTFDGIKLATRTRQVVKNIPNIGDITQTFEFSKTEQNVDIAADAFAMPENIKEMMKENDDK